jgi:ATP adenylyltransferase
MIIKHNLVTPNKFDYVRGKKPEVECILCSVLENDPNVDNLVLYKSRLMSVTLNLYPYNPGHLMIFPNRHITDLRKLSKSEWSEVYDMQILCMNILEKIYNPSGYNLGFNLGQYGGASIPHIHFHIVPRYKNEIGFIELFTDSRIIVEHPEKTYTKLKPLFEDYRISKTKKKNNKNK